jgi:acetyl-CoA acetyltransferase family protein
LPPAMIIDAVRTPSGKGRASGALAKIHPVDLLGTVLRGLIQRSGIEPGIVDDVIIGCVSQAGEQSVVPGRMAWLASGYPQHVPSTTIDRQCGSSQQAVHFGAQAIMAGVCDVVIAGGLESMSRVPMFSSRMGADPYGPGYAARYAPGQIDQGISAELVAARWQIERETLDAYAVRSHGLAATAAAAGWFDNEILAVAVDGASVRADETIRPGSTVEKLAQLKPAFVDAAMEARFPEIRWRVTAGNSSQISDGASAMLLMSETMAARLNLVPRARLVAFDVCGDDPIAMLTAPIPATRRLLQKAGLQIGDIDHFEINEAFAPVPLAWQTALGADAARLNPCGGAIALGHPLGASGTRLMTTMLNALERSGGRYGLQSMCEAGGMANATLIERV